MNLPLDPVLSKISCQKSLLPRKISHKPSVRQTSRVQTVIAELILSRLPFLQNKL